MGIFSEAFDLIDTAGGLLPSGTGSIGSLTGETGAAAALEGAQLQAGSAELALEETRAARLQGRELLQPFVDIGQRQIPAIEGLLGTSPGAPESLINQARFNQGLGFLGAGESLRNVSSLTGADTGALAQAAGLSGEVSTIGGLDPNVLQSPFFQAAQAEATRNLEQSAASRGKLGAGGTSEAIARQSLLLAPQFAQQQQQADLAAKTQRFGQARSALGVDLTQQQLNQENIRNAQSQRFKQLQSSLGFGLGAQQVGFQQVAGAQRQDFTNQLVAQQQNLSQRQQLLGLGQASAAGVGAQGQLGASQASGLLTGIGNAQAAGGIGAANALAQGSQNVLQVGGFLAGAFSDRRLKKNIKLIGKTQGGNNWYSYDYIWGESSEGVMADEVKHIKGAVIRHESGFDMVNYGVIE